MPDAPVVLYNEDFENRPGSTPLVRLNGYTASAANKLETYTADPAWLKNCNGWVAQWNQPVDLAGPTADCAGQIGWNRTQQLAQALGLLGGKTAEEARNNFAVSAFTSGDPGVGKVEFRTGADLNLASATGRYLTTSIDVAAISCPPQAKSPKLQFQLVSSTAATTNVGGLMDACQSGHPVDAEARGVNGKLNVHVGTYTSNGSVFWTGSTVGIRLINFEGSGTGNDHAFDNIRLVDATPRLDKSFSPAVFAPGDTTRLTFTVTNTAELASKNGWSFTDNLSAGLRVAAQPNVATSCPANQVTADAGAATVKVAGDLPTGTAACTISVDLTAGAAGSYTNGAANLTPITGLNAPTTTQTATASDTDFGDAPASYGDASHTELSGLRLGATRDIDFTAQPSADAGSDDATVSDDEDALSGTVALRPDQAVHLPVAVRDSTGAPATLVGWIDANGDGDFADPGERSQLGAVLPGATSADLVWDAMPAAKAGSTFVRLRLYPATAKTFDPTGAAVGGEVEDHPVTLQVPRLSLTKTASTVDDKDGNGVDAGDVITYTLAVSNDGSTNLNPVTVTDPLLGGAVPCVVGALAIGASATCPDIAYTLTQDDLDNGLRANTASALGTPPTGPDVTASASTSTPLPSRSLLTMVKDHGPITDTDGNGPDAGDTVAYTFEVSNPGNRKLTGMTVTDALTGPVDCPQTALAPGASTTCTATYRLTQADVDAGTVLNTATARATSPDGALSSTDKNNLPIPARQGLELDKSAGPVTDVDKDGEDDAGDEIAYTFVLTNSGNTSLTGVKVVDPLLTKAGAKVSCPGATLAGGESMTCTATYQVTQADVDAAGVENVAHADGTGPKDIAVTSADDSVATPLHGRNGLQLITTVGGVTDTNTSGRPDAGDTVELSYVVTNTGTVTLTGLAIDDPGAEGLDCPTTTLAPGESVTCTAKHVLTQDDLDAGGASSTSTATTSGPGGVPVTSEEQRTLVGAPGVAGIALVKHAELKDRDGDDLADRGETIRYTFEVRNGGTTTLTSVHVDDPMLAADEVDVVCPADRLGFGETMTCVADYPVRTSDLGHEIDNVATAGADARAEKVSSEPSEVVVQADKVPLKPTPPPPPVTPHHPPGTHGTLPNTGGPAAGLALGGLLLLMGGFLLLRMSRDAEPKYVGRRVGPRGSRSTYR